MECNCKNKEHKIKYLNTIICSQLALYKSTFICTKQILQTSSIYMVINDRIIL